MQVLLSGPAYNEGEQQKVCPMLQKPCITSACMMWKTYTQTLHYSNEWSKPTPAETPGVVEVSEGIGARLVGYCSLAK